MSDNESKGISMALVSLLVAFLGFWGAQAASDKASTTAMSERIASLEQRALELHSLKLESDRFIIKLEYELQKKTTALAIIETYIDRIPLPVWIKRKPQNGLPVMVMINDAYALRYGISKDAYQGATDFEVWPRELAERFLKADLEVMRRKTAIRTLEEVIENGERKSAVVWKFYLQLPSGEDGVGGIISC